MIKHLRENKVFYLFFIVILFFLTLFFTWPLVLDLKNSVYGYSGDSFGYIYYLWWWRRSIFEHLDIRFLSLQEAPFGTVVPKEVGTIVFLWPSYLLTFFFGDVLSYNFLLLISFPLSGVFSYLLFFEMTKDKITSLIFSLVFAFSPYHFWKAYNHLDLSMIQYIPLFLWSLIRLERVKNLKRALICGLTLSILILLNFYYGFFALLTLSLFFLFGIILEIFRKELKIIKRIYLYSLVLISSFLISVPFILPVLKTFIFKSPITVATAEVYQRPLDNLLLLTARPWSYFLPSIDNPFLGGLSLKAYKFIKGLSNDFKTDMPFPHETTVYLGLFSLIFFLLSIYLWWRGKINNKILPLLIFTTLGLFIMSLPPFVIIKNITIRLPSFYLHQYFPMFRSYGRLGIFVLPLFAAIASLGFSYFLSGLKSRKKVLAIFASVIFIMFEFTNIPPFKVTSFAKIPAVYEWLKRESGDPIILEYPKNFNLTEGELFQRYHLKKTANWHSPSPYFGLWNYVEDIYDSVSFEILSGLNVKYVIFHEKLLFDKPNPADEFWIQRAYTSPIRADKLPSNIKIVGNFDGAQVYSIASDKKPKVVIITNNSGGQPKVDVVGGESFDVSVKSEVFIINLTKNRLDGSFSDGKKSERMEIPPGKVVVSYSEGKYKINLTIIQPSLSAL